MGRKSKQVIALDNLLTALAALMLSLREYKPDAETVADDATPAAGSDPESETSKTHRSMEDVEAWAEEQRSKMSLGLSETADPESETTEEADPETDTAADPEADAASETDELPPEDDGSDPEAEAPASPPAPSRPRPAAASSRPASATAKPAASTATVPSAKDVLKAIASKPKPKVAALLKLYKVGNVSEIPAAKLSGFLARVKAL